MKTEYGDKINISAGILCIVGVLLISGLAVARLAQEYQKKSSHTPEKIKQTSGFQPYRLMPSHCR